MKRLIFLVMVLPMVVGCGVYRPLQIEPQHRGTPIAPKFSEDYYYYDRDQNLYFVMRSVANDAAGKPVEQVATLRVFWRPRGGITSLNATSMNATIRYMIMTPDAIGMYEGAGFVRLNSKTGAGRFDARVVDSDLRLTQKNDRFVDNLGRARMTGTFTSTYDDAKAEGLLLDTQRAFFARSLKSQPPAAATATAPAATAPATSTSPAASQP